MIDIELDDAQLRRAIAHAQRRMGDLRPVMQEIGEYLVVSTKERFATSTAPDGSRWAPNSEATVAALLRARGGIKRKGAPGSKRPLIGETQRLSTEINYRATSDSVAVGSAEEYAATQQFGANKGAFGRTRRGAPIPFGDIPARPFLGLSPDDRREILDILSEHLRRTMGGP
jgi:phage virion morphogenesis protein